MRNGIRLAAEEINAIGGINGRRIELVERDDQASNELGATIAADLVRERVVATVGVSNTGAGMASIDHYQNAKIPLIIAVSSGNTLTRKFAPPAAAENYIFRVAPTQDLDAKVLVREIRKRGFNPVAVLADTTAYGESALKIFDHESRIAGIKISAVERFQVGDTEALAQIRRAKESGAKALILWGIGPEMAAVARSRAAIGWNVPVLGSWPLSMRNFIDAAGSAGDGAMMTQTFIPEAGALSKTAFLLAYRNQFKTDVIPSPMSAAQGYDGMHLLHLAIRQAGSTDGTKIKEALESLKARYQGAVTNYVRPFTKEDHEAITANMLLIGMVQDGRIEYAHSEDERRGALLRLKSKP